MIWIYYYMFWISLYSLYLVTVHPLPSNINKTTIMVSLIQWHPRPKQNHNSKVKIIDRGNYFKKIILIYKWISEKDVLFWIFSLNHLYDSVMHCFYFPCKKTIWFIDNFQNNYFYIQNTKLEGTPVLNICFRELLYDINQNQSKKPLTNIFDTFDRFTGQSIFSVINYIYSHWQHLKEKRKNYNAI